METIEKTDIKTPVSCKVLISNLNEEWARVNWEKSIANAQKHWNVFYKCRGLSSVLSTPLLRFAQLALFEMHRANCLNEDQEISRQDLFAFTVQFMGITDDVSMARSFVSSLRQMHQEGSLEAAEWNGVDLIPKNEFMDKYAEMRDSILVFD